MKNLEKCILCSSSMEDIFEYHDYIYSRCLVCSLVSTYPIPDEKAIIAHYKERNSGGNYELYQDYKDKYSNVYKGYADQINKYLIKFSNPNLSGKKILDIGCLTGDFLEIMDERGATPYGVELQKEAVEIANKKFPGRIFQADIFSNDFPNMTFDIISVLGVIEHVVDPDKLLQRSYELLNPGGLIILQTPDSSSFLAKLMGKYWFCYEPIEHIHLFSKNSINLVLENLFLKNIVVKQHWKTLPINYIFLQLKNFGTEFYNFFKPLENIFKKIELSVPFYIGEMLIIAKKPD